jgi:hypothetical protein
MRESSYYAMNGIQGCGLQALHWMPKLETTGRIYG